MVKFLQEKIGDRTPPEFEGEKDFFIPTGIFFLEVKECSDEANVTLLRMLGYVIGGAN